MPGVEGIRITPAEAFAFAVVGNVMAVDVEPYDGHGRQNAVDALLHYPDEHSAALEVSSIGPEAEAHLTAVLNGEPRTIEGLRRTWFVTVPRDVPPKRLTKINQTLLRCEELGADRLDKTDGDPVTEDLIELGVHAWVGTAPSGRDPVAWVTPAAIGGFTEAGAANLTAEILAALDTDTMRGKLDKLNKSGYDERHLFLHVRPSALSFPIFEVLVFGGDLPTDAPTLPAGLSQLWLTSGFKRGGILRAISGRGWSRFDPFD